MTPAERRSAGRAELADPDAVELPNGDDFTASDDAAVDQDVTGLVSFTV